MPAFECKPSISINERGEEVVDYNNPTFATRGGFQSEMSDFTFNESTGQVSHNTPIDAEHPSYQTESSEDDYFSALSEAFPMAEMISYATQAWSPERVNDFNNIIESGDYGQVNEALENLQQEMLANGFVDEPQQPEQSSPDFSDAEVSEIEQSYPVAELQEYLQSNYDEETIEMFDAVVEQGTIEQVRELYDTLYQDYLGVE